MTSKLLFYAQFFPLKEAYAFYKYGKRLKDTTLHFSMARHPIHLRGIVSDREIFAQIFIQQQYKFFIPTAPATILDLGANVGLASVYFANLFPEAIILALEPEKANYEQACKNLAPYKKVSVLQAAVWYKPGQLSVYDKGHGEAAFMVEEPGYEQAQKPLSQVPAYTIPQLAEKLGTSSIDLIKMDVEGAEKELFENNADEWLPHTKMLVVETHDRYKPGTSKALFTALLRHRFLLEVRGENLIFYNTAFYNKIGE